MATARRSSAGIGGAGPLGRFGVPHPHPRQSSDICPLRVASAKHFRSRGQVHALCGGSTRFPIAAADLDVFAVQSGDLGGATASSAPAWPSMPRMAAAMVATGYSPLVDRAGHDGRQVTW